MKDWKIIAEKQREMIKYLIKKIPPAKRGKIILNRLKAIAALESEPDIDLLS